MAEVIRTFGHGTLSEAALIDLLQGAGVECVIDIRRFPGSRRHPQFNSEAMAGWLQRSGVDYHWFVELGGRRKPLPDSPNLALHHPQFRGYADHMASAEFATGVSKLIELAQSDNAAIMCSESVWWRCHRRLLSDHLVLMEGISVRHLFHDGRETAHPPMAEARKHNGHLVYG